MEFEVPQLDRVEAVKLAAANTRVYSKLFFPRTVRMESPPIHDEIDSLMDNPVCRYVNLKMFRGSAKTTKVRLYTSKRIAFALSHTILYIGASEAHAIRSVQWVRNAVERNTFWAQTFGLRPGKKWSETELEIIHGVDDRPIWLMGVGITGNIRGINFDDYRPDLILLDDTLTDENTATLEQRAKLSNLILGAVKDSLTPATEEPNAKLVNLQTPMHPEDASSEMSRDPQFTTLEFPCWTKDTLELPVERQVSSWPERFPTATLREEKLAAIARNKLSIFTREMEVRLVAPELATFRPEWLRFWDTQPTGCYSVLVIDPVPPPTPAQMSKQLRGKDSEAHGVVGRKNGEYYALETRENKGHEPNWTVTTAIELARKYRVAKIILLAVGYERAIESMLRKEMQRRGVYWAIEIPAHLGRSKFVRIINGLQGTASAGKLWVGRHMATFLQQFQEYGPTYTGHDDVLEVVAAGVEALVNPYLEMGADDYMAEAEMDRDFHYPRAAP